MYCNEKDTRRHVEIDPDDGIQVRDDEVARIIGSGQPVIVQKEYGPLGACSVRVHLDKQAGEWVVEKQVEEHRPVEGLEPQYWEYLRSHWIEVVRFDCQPDDLINGQDVIDVPTATPPALPAAATTKELPAGGERKLLKYILRHSACDRPIDEVPADGDIDDDLYDQACVICATRIEHLTVEAIYDRPLPPGHTYWDATPGMVRRVTERFSREEPMEAAVAAEIGRHVEALDALQHLDEMRKEKGRSKTFDVSVSGMMRKALRKKLGFSK